MNIIGSPGRVAGDEAAPRAPRAFVCAALVEIGWKGMLVLSFANLVLTAVIVGLIV